ncbi:MAG TPA: hypothetical protein VG944_09785 [Fimbriimonas sp.]|nr:hypothetical protein [Fimbriimonas sp.]
MDRTPRPPRKLSPVLTVILALGGVLLLLCCGGGYLLIRYVGPYQAAGDLPEAVAAYRQTGLPWEAKDLSPQPPVSKDKNAASLVNRCTLALNQKSLGKGIENISQLSEKGQFAEAEKGLIPFAEVMKLGEQAARLGRADFGHDWDQGPNVLSPELLTFKEVCKLLAARAQLEAAHGQVGSAIQDLRNARKIGDLASQNEGLIPMLVQIAIGSISCRAEQHCAELWAQDAAALRRLDALEGENQSEPDFLHALRGEA